MSALRQRRDQLTELMGKLGYQPTLSTKTMNGGHVIDFCVVFKRMAEIEFGYDRIEMYEEMAYPDQKGESRLFAWNWTGSPSKSLAHEVVNQMIRSNIPARVTKYKGDVAIAYKLDFDWAA